MKFFDAHIHFFHQCSLDELRNKLTLIKGDEIGGMDVLVIAEFPPELDTALQMIPGQFHPHITRDALESQRDPFPLLHSCHSLEIVPFVDARFMAEDMEEKIKAYHQKGFKGLKLLYVPEEDQGLRIGGMEKTFNRTRKESENITSRLVDAAASQGMPVLIHVDLRKHGPFVEEMVKGHPATHFNIPHFGFSRRAISPLLERYSNCYTDLSSMAPFMEKDAGPYRDFVETYQDKVLFGSDAWVDQPEQIHSAMKSISRIIGDERIVNKVMNRNYNLFHTQHSEGRPSAPSGCPRS